MRRKLATEAWPRPAPARRALLLLSLGLVATSPGCSAMSHYRPTHSGLLTDYSGLTKDPFHLNYGLGLERTLTHAVAPDALATIDSYFIEPIGWAVDPSSRAGRDPTRPSVLSTALDAALREQLGTLLPIVAEPGPHTARVHAFITDARLSRPLSNTALTAAGFFVPALGPVFFGGAVVEAEVLAPDHRQLAAISCASGGGALDVVGFYTRSGHAKKAMRRAARELREAITPLQP